MARRIIPIFLPNSGCPHRCVFCNERITAGSSPESVTPADVRQIVQSHLDASLTGGKIKGRENPERQIAFYGGNFSGIDPGYQVELLETAQGYVDSGEVESIRISTRPDSIHAGTLEILKRYSVRTVEIGAQSMVDSVLACCNRGHTAQDTRLALRQLKQSGFETGLHLMAGLPGDTPEGFVFSVEEAAALKPDMVRLHPTIVFRDTELASLYSGGHYRPLDLETAVLYCRSALDRFRKARVDVIRIGLQPTPEMEEPGAIVAGPFHPAFRSLVEGSIFLAMAQSLLKLRPEEENKGEDESFTFFVSDRDQSDFRGIGNCNITLLRKRYGTGISVQSDPGLNRGTLILRSGSEEYWMNRSEFVLPKARQDQAY